jgi:twinkle protein
MLEEDVGRTLKGIAGKRNHKMYHRPDFEYSDSEIRQVISDLKGKVFLYDHMGVKDWSDIKAAIRYLVVSEGVRDIFLDPLTALVAHLSASEANDALNSIMSDMSGMVHELDFTCHWFGHLNLPTNGPPHEAGGQALESQLTGSRAMMKWSHFVFMLQGNKSPELDEIERNTREFVVRKDRAFGNVCKFQLFYNNQTGTLLEPVGGMY